MITATMLYACITGQEQLTTALVARVVQIQEQLYNGKTVLSL